MNKHCLKCRVSWDAPVSRCPECGGEPLNALLDHWRTLPASSNEVVAVEIIEGLLARLQPSQFGDMSATPTPRTDLLYAPEARNSAEYRHAAQLEREVAAGAMPDQQAIASAVERVLALHEGQRIDVVAKRVAAEIASLRCTAPSARREPYFCKTLAAARGTPGYEAEKAELDRAIAASSTKRTLAEAMPDTNADGSYTYRPSPDKERLWDVARMLEFQAKQALEGGKRNIEIDAEKIVPQIVAVMDKTAGPEPVDSSTEENMEARKLAEAAYQQEHEIRLDREATISLIAESLGVAPEPHQTFFERLVDAARAPSATALTREQAAQEVESRRWSVGDALTVKIHNNAVDECAAHLRRVPPEERHGS